MSPAATNPAVLTVFCPLRTEAVAVRRGARSARVVRTGMGPQRSTRVTAPDGPLVVAGFCGALVDTWQQQPLRPGDVVVATELHHGDAEPHRLGGAEMIAAALRRAGQRAHAAPMACEPVPVTGTRRGELAASGCAAVDMESAWLLAGRRQDPAAGPTAVVRVVVDTPNHELRSLGTPWRALKAARTLARAMPTLETWAAAAGPRTVVLAGPRSFCAGVERAIEIVERALQRFGPPVYIRKQIVHNTHVVHALEELGAVFVDELDEVPDGGRVVFAAHGVSPEVRRRADERGLPVIDATCPLVAKVHVEARRFAEQGYSIVLIGHRDHEEVEGTLGEAPDRIHVIASASEVADLRLPDPQRVAFITQTTLAVDEVDAVAEELRRRYPGIVAPRSEDVCYATQNRQEAVRAVAAEVDAMVVVGSPNSSNSRRLVEVAGRAGCPARLVDTPADLDPAWLAGADTVGVTAGASAPGSLVDDVVALIATLGPVTVTERTVTEESVQFSLPAEVR